MKSKLFTAGFSLSLLAMGLALLMDFDSDHGLRSANRRQQSGDFPSQTTERINSWMHEADQNRNLKSKDVELNNLATSPIERQAAPTIGASVLDRSLLGVRLDRENQASAVAADLEGLPTAKEDQFNPERRINSRLEKKQWLSEFERQERSAFIREFIRRANYEGWRVEVNEQTLEATVIGRLRAGEANRIPQSLIEGQGAN